MSVIDIEEAYPTYVLELAEAEANAARLLASLRDFLENPLFQVSVGGNPIAVDAMLARARNAIAKAEARQ